MRSKKLLVANWKMNPLTFKEAERIGHSLDQGIKSMNKKDFTEKVEIVVCPPALYLNCLKKSQFWKLGIQNIHWETRGAFTGEISPRMADNAGCEYAIIGHSERRIYFKETDQIVNQKLKTALENSLNPILCVGETKEEREKNNTNYIIRKQIELALKNVSILALPKLIIAYEPVWAINSAQNSNNEADTPDDIMVITILIRKILKELYHSDVTDKVKIIYGGSVNQKNIAGLTEIDVHDGFLVGTASLSMFDFLPIIKRVYNQ